MLIPSRLQLDASSHCQLACGSCPTASGHVRPVLGAGHLSLENLVNLIDQNPQITDLELSNYGEMFLNPDLGDILRFCSERHVVLHADNGVNLNYAPPQMLETLVRYKFRSFTCSIDGTTNDVYQIYRRKGNFETVINNLRCLNSFKRQYKSAFPQLTWQFIVFKHNVSQVDDARRLARELGMHFYTKLSWSNFDVAPEDSLVQVRAGVGYTSREEFQAATGNDYCRPICYQLWNAPVLNWDGKVLGCCRNFWRDFGGNAFHDGLIGVVNSTSMEHARRVLQGHEHPSSDIPCADCEIYNTLRSTGNWLTDEEISRAREKGRGILLSVVPSWKNAHGSAYIDVRSAERDDFRTRRRFNVNTDNFCLIRVPSPGRYLVQLQPEDAPSGQRTCSDIQITILPKPIVQEHMLVF